VTTGNIRRNQLSFTDEKDILATGSARSWPQRTKKGEPLAMPADPLRLLSFCRAIEEASDDGLQMLDRDSLLAVHKALTAVKEANTGAVSAIGLALVKLARTSQTKSSTTSWRSTPQRQFRGTCTAPDEGAVGGGRGVLGYGHPGQ
jgi:hypothetical protein